MGLDTVGKAVTEPWLNMVLVATVLPIPAPWLPWLTALGRRVEELFDQSINRHGGAKATPVAVVDSQLSQSQFGILSGSTHDLGGLAALPGDGIPSATDPYEVSVLPKPADMATHGSEGTHEDLLDNPTETG